MFSDFIRFLIQFLVLARSCAVLVIGWSSQPPSSPDELSGARTHHELVQDVLTICDRTSSEMNWPKRGEWEALIFFLASFISHWVYLQVC